MDLDETTTTDDDETPKPARKRGPRKKPAVSTTRLERRAGKVTATIKEASKWKLHRDNDDAGFVETVQKDADPIGHAVAGIAERFKPAGMIIDLLFGEAGPLSILVALAPSIRAARRTLKAKAEARKRRQLEAQERIAQEDGDVELPTEEEWLRSQNPQEGE